ncbi:hypothetical protein ABVK25_003745 [Lepraria finkii]|uniref:Uncharacterized protein n=1 Tax=Lepraria finkii TaxID=1340010 RepID=A0ABR4BF98_9LECA
MYAPIFTNKMSMMTESAQNNMQLENGPSRINMQIGQTHVLPNNVPTCQVPSHGNIFSSDFHRNVPSHRDLTPSNSTSTGNYPSNSTSTIYTPTNSTPTIYSPTNSALIAHSLSPSKTTRRGRPPGSKNKPKGARVTKVPKKKGRPLGSKNKPKFPATNLGKEPSIRATISPNSLTINPLPMATFYSLFPLTHPLNATTTSLIVSCEIVNATTTPSINQTHMVTDSTAPA